ncbi:unnamed protein product [Rotaria magnacalcarata]|uniref:Innexin n=1 Tax=Rotaria magnacalcarata TaxID=392030 RepID=A0A8S2P187_9BILA|nr:unnamed protein product [Rotaria magnacalcarata]
MVDIIYIITLVPTILLSSLRSDDDAFDKINYKYTVALLVLFATITATKQFEDDRIECWNRANFIKSYIAYTNQICYISSTYYVNRNKTISDNIQDRINGDLCSFKSIIGLSGIGELVECKPINVTVIQVYAPTTGADDEEIEDFYVSLQQLVDATPKKIPLSSWAIGTPK